MKKSDVPQDKSALEHFTREVCYVKDDKGNYDTALSEGWDVKKEALDEAWKEIDRRVQDAANAVKSGSASPIVYFMELKLMDLVVLSGYTGFRKWTIKRHMKPTVFAKLAMNKLEKYAKAFDVSTDELKKFKG